jgi:hypothetical protein
MARPRRATAAEIGDGEDRCMDIDDPGVPPAVRAGVLRRMQTGDQLWRCPRMSGPSGLLGFGQGYPVIEWWLLSAEGDLIEAFWEQE